MVNAKRVLKVMQKNGLPFKSIPHCGPPSSRRCGQCHAFQHPLVFGSFRDSCPHGEAVRIVFVIVAFDRKIIAWSADSNASISREMVCDLMIAALKRRFQIHKVPHRVQWLSDNGSAYTARQTVQVAAALRIVLHFTLVRIPTEQRNVPSLRQDPEAGLRFDRHPFRR